jgi:hypothetical protein
VYGPQGCRKVAGFFIGLDYQMHVEKKSAVSSIYLPLPSFFKSNRHMEWYFSHLTVRRPAVRGGDGLHTWREPMITINEELRRADKGKSLSSGVVEFSP